MGDFRRLFLDIVFNDIVIVQRFQRLQIFLLFLGVGRYAISLDTHVNSSKCFPTLCEIGAKIRRELLSRCELNDTLYSLQGIISVVPLSCVKVYVVVL